MRSADCAKLPTNGRVDFSAKSKKHTARCRGGEKAVDLRSQPWIDWQNYWAAGDAASKAPGLSGDHLTPNGRGIDGALLDFEYQRIELIKFNLFDNTGTYEEYIKRPGTTLMVLH